MNIIDVTGLIGKRKEFIIVCFIAGALLSPPDEFAKLKPAICRIGSIPILSTL